MTTMTNVNNPETIRRPAASAARAGGRPAFARWSRYGGIGGLVFASSVIAQNVLRSGFPAGDAAAGDVLDFYADHRSITLVLAALFPLGAVGLAAFVGALIARVAHGEARMPAFAGLVGTAGILGNFTMLLATDLTISGYVHRGAADTSVVEGLWVLHNAVFGVLLASIGIALAGFAMAGVKSGLLSGRWKTAGLVGGTLLVAAAATTPAIIDAGPTALLGLVGFVVWVVFVIRSSIALLRTSDATTR
jgi:hypothetical protein